MAFKMKGHSLPGPHQRKSPAKDFEGEVHDHPHTSGKKKTSEAMKQAVRVAKASNLKETNKLLAAQGKDPVKEIPDSPAASKSPAKIAPLVMMGAQMLGKKMMEKKQEKDSPGLSKSPAKRADVYIDGENIGTGPEARAKAHKVAQENVKLQHKQDVAGVDYESPEYDTGKKIKYTDEDEKINKQAVKDLHKMRTVANPQLVQPKSTPEERRRAVSTNKYQSVPAETASQSKARRRKAKQK